MGNTPSSPPSSPPTQQATTTSTSTSTSITDTRPDQTSTSRLPSSPSDNMATTSPTSTPIPTPTPNTPLDQTARPPTQALESYPIRSTPRPIPLNAAQEAEVRNLYYRRVRKKCDPEIRAFATCTSNRTLTLPFSCRPTRRAMNTCMLQYATREEEDAAREQWFEEVGERRRKAEAEEVERRRLERGAREFWGEYHGRGGGGGVGGGGSGRGGGVGKVDGGARDRGSGRREGD
ncbi:MAG: hypothetical protein M1831_001784 [Alyxoria varia]|nr:MAG: hypothetical protein M1831_001784 [Alyxoria varia]